MNPDWTSAMQAAEASGLFTNRVLFGRSQSGAYFVMSGRGVIAINYDGPQCIRDAIEYMREIKRQ